MSTKTRVTAVQELRRSSAASPHTNRRPRGTDRRNAIAEQQR